MKLIAPQEESESRIDVTPLIDILFTLIIFFLVTSTFEKEEKEEKVQLPRHGGSSLTNKKEHPFYVNVLQDGTYSVQGEAVDLDHLRVMLIDRFKEKPDQRVVIRGDTKAFHGQTTAALAATSQAGFSSVNIAWDTSPIE